MGPILGCCGLLCICACIFFAVRGCNQNKPPAGPGGAHALVPTVPGSNAPPPQVAVQMTYTWAFGVFAAFVFVRTGRVAPAVASHAFCNYMGLPHIGFLWADHHLHRHRPSCSCLLMRRRAGSCA